MVMTNTFGSWTVARKLAHLADVWRKPPVESCDDDRLEALGDSRVPCLNDRFEICRGTMGHMRTRLLRSLLGIALLAAAGVAPAAIIAPLTKSSPGPTLTDKVDEGHQHHRQLTLHNPRPVLCIVGTGLRAEPGKRAGTNAGAGAFTLESSLGMKPLITATFFRAGRMCSLRRSGTLRPVC
jgi:hypothetical protein